MSIELITDAYPGTLPDTFDLQETADAVLQAMTEVTGCPYACTASLTVTTDKEIRELNREMRGIDKSTDVLSFPAMQYTSPEAFEEAEEEIGAFDPESGELMLGDIVISWPHAEKQAEEYGHSLRREFAFLTAHSLLHLAGHDHMTDGERTVMEERQRQILSACAIGRDAE